MGKYFQWILLSMLLGSRVGALVVLVVFWWAADRATLQLFPSPWRAWQRWRRRRRLGHVLRQNPHDRRARLELGDLLVARGHPAEAVEVLKPNVAAGDDDAPTLYLLGVACLGAQHVQQGELFLEEARKREPTFRLGAIDLELGRWRLFRGDAPAAREALERFCAVQRGTIEGKVLLGRAYALSGDGAAAKRANDEAWANYETSPTFQQRRDRFWAWRARPSRPLTYAAVALVVAIVAARFAVPPLRAYVKATQAAARDNGDD